MFSAFLFYSQYTLRSFLSQGQRRQRNKSCAGKIQGCYRRKSIFKLFEDLACFVARVYLKVLTIEILRVYNEQVINLVTIRSSRFLLAVPFHPNSRALFKIIHWKLIQFINILHFHPAYCPVIS